MSLNLPAAAAAGVAAESDTLGLCAGAETAHHVEGVLALPEGVLQVATTTQLQHQPHLQAAGRHHVSRRIRTDLKRAKLPPYLVWANRSRTSRSGCHSVKFKG